MTEEIPVDISSPNVFSFCHSSLTFPAFSHVISGIFPIRCPNREIDVQ